MSRAARDPGAGAPMRFLVYLHARAVHRTRNKPYKREYNIKPPRAPSGKVDHTHRTITRSVSGGASVAAGRFKPTPRVQMRAEAARDLGHDGAHGAAGGRVAVARELVQVCRAVCE